MLFRSQLIKLALCTCCCVGASNVLAANVTASQDLAGRVESAYDQSSVEGKVTAKSGKSITVSGKSIAITDDTTFTKDGKSATSAVVDVGDKVKITTKKAADGSLQAVSVEVE